MCKGTKAWDSMGVWEMYLKQKRKSLSPKKEIPEKEFGSMLWDLEFLDLLSSPCCHPWGSFFSSLLSLTPQRSIEDKGTVWRYGNQPGHSIKKEVKPVLKRKTEMRLLWLDSSFPRFSHKTECGTFGRRSEEITPAEMRQGLGTLCVRNNSHLRDVGIKRIEAPAWDPERKK